MKLQISGIRICFFYSKLFYRIFPKSTLLKSYTKISTNNCFSSSSRTVWKPWARASILNVSPVPIVVKSLQTPLSILRTAYLTAKKVVFYRLYSFYSDVYVCLDWNELFTTKCISCGFPIEAGDRWVEALNNNYHSQCFNCTVRLQETYWKICYCHLENVWFYFLAKHSK